MHTQWKNPSSTLFCYLKPRIRVCIKSFYILQFFFFLLRFQLLQLRGKMINKSAKATPLQLFIYILSSFLCFLSALRWVGEKILLSFVGVVRKLCHLNFFKFSKIFLISKIWRSLKNLSKLKIFSLTLPPNYPQLKKISYWKKGACRHCHYNSASSLGVYTHVKPSMNRFKCVYDLIILICSLHVNIIIEH